MPPGLLTLMKHSKRCPLRAAQAGPTANLPAAADQAERSRRAMGGGRPEELTLEPVPRVGVARREALTYGDGMPTCSFFTVARCFP